MGSGWFGALLCRFRAKNAVFSQKIACERCPRRRKGELSPAGINRGWSIRSYLPARFCERGGYKEIHEFCADLTLCSRGHSPYHDGQGFHVYCFMEPADAQKFLKRFGGETFDPTERGHSTNWRGEEAMKRAANPVRLPSF
jgi:hypothetical protein